MAPREQDRKRASDHSRTSSKSHHSSSSSRRDKDRDRDRERDKYKEDDDTYKLDSKRSDYQSTSSTRYADRHSSSSSSSKPKYLETKIHKNHRDDRDRRDRQTRHHDNLINKSSSGHDGGNSRKRHHDSESPSSRSMKSSPPPPSRADHNHEPTSASPLPSTLSTPASPKTNEMAAPSETSLIPIPPQSDGADEEELMKKLMGFADFDSTKGKHIEGNDVSAVHVAQKRKYRQYMNRKGGFNRPLDRVV